MRYKIAEGEFPALKPMQEFGAPRVGHLHEGIDLANGASFKCLAWKDGVIEKRKYNNVAGYSAWVKHTDGTRSLYCHITKSSYDDLKQGQKAKAGDCVGMAGRTGNATAILLHYEYHIKGEPVNPVDYVTGDLPINDDEVKIPTTFFNGGYYQSRVYAGNVQYRSITPEGFQKGAKWGKWVNIDGCDNAITTELYTSGGTMMVIFTRGDGSVCTCVTADGGHYTFPVN